MFLTGSLVISAYILVSSDASSVPSYIKVCKKNDHDCYVKNANDAISHFLNGDKNLHLPKLNPLVLQKIDANAGNLQLTFTDVKVKLDNIKVLDLSWDTEEHKIYTEINVDNVELTSQYEVGGKIMVLPVQGSGPCNLTFKNMHLKYNLKYKIETKGDLKYLKPDPNDDLDWTVEKSYFHYDNLFNGNKAMGDNVNKFINENDKEVLKEMSGVVTAVIKPVLYRTYSAVWATIPMDKLFL